MNAQRPGRRRYVTEAVEAGTQCATNAPRCSAPSAAGRFTGTSDPLDAQLSEADNAEIDALCDQCRFYGTDSAISPLPLTSPAETPCS